MLVTSETFKIDCFIICFVTSGSGCQCIQFITYFITCQAVATLVPRNWQDPLLRPRTTCLNTLDGKIFNQEKDLKSVPHAWILRCWNIQSGNICFSDTYLYMFPHHRKNIADVKNSFWMTRGGICARNLGSFLWTRAQRSDVAWTLNNVVLDETMIMFICIAS